jgi:transglutaminase-like putative cysteine protease
VALSIFWASLASVAGAKDRIPEPDVNRVDYAHPEKYLELPRTTGKRSTVQRIAAEIGGDSPRAKLAGISAWIGEQLRYDENATYAWRDIDRMLADGTFGGCADHAMLFGVLARAGGIPTVWVKTMDVEWIRAFRRDGDENRSWSGHVFLEVYIDGGWVLLDATQGVLYEEYDTDQRILPGDRLAYDKGGDPYDVLLSTRWEEWKEQTRKFFRDFDLARLPVGKGTPLTPAGTVFLAADNPAWQWMADRCRELGRRVGYSGNQDFEAWLPSAREGVLVVACREGRMVLPERFRDLLPKDWKKVVAERDSGVITNRADDGTSVVLVFGRDDEALRNAIQEMELP